MPEGDTIHRAARTLRAALVGERLARVEVARHPAPLPTTGSHVTGVEARGKHLLIHTSDGLSIHTHQRMTGSWHLYRPGERWRKSPRAARVVLATARVVAVCFAAPVVEVLDVRGLARHPALRRLGPDLCEPSADLDDAAARLHRLSDPQRPVGEALLDQRIACGVGNVYRCDVLFLHQLHPWTPVGTVSTREARALIDTSAQLLRDNVDRVRRTTTAGPEGSLWVHGRGGAPCRRCATPVEVAPLGEQARFAYWCPTCQPAPPGHAATS
jgi:endonuclease VIII